MALAGSIPSRPRCDEDTPASEDGSAEEMHEERGAGDPAAGSEGGIACMELRQEGREEGSAGEPLGGSRELGEDGNEGVGNASPAQSDSVSEGGSDEGQSSSESRSSQQVASQNVFAPDDEQSAPRPQGSEGEREGSGTRSTTTTPESSRGGHCRDGCRWTGHRVAEIRNECDLKRQMNCFFEFLPLEDAPPPAVPRCRRNARPSTATVERHLPGTMKWGDKRDEGYARECTVRLLRKEMYQQCFDEGSAAGPSVQGSLLGMDSEEHFFAKVCTSV